MNETLSSSIWPNFQNSRPSWSESYSSNSINAWHPTNNPTSDYFNSSSVDFNNVWSAKSEIAEESDKDSYIKSIWSSSTSSSPCDSISSVSENQNPKPLNHNHNVDSTPTNSPLLSRMDLVLSHERWGSTRINQTTPWSIGDCSDDSESRSSDPMVWRARVDGTELWEEYYTRQHGQRRPQIDSGLSMGSSSTLSGLGGHNTHGGPHGSHPGPPDSVWSLPHGSHGNHNAHINADCLMSPQQQQHALWQPSTANITTAAVAISNNNNSKHTVTTAGNCDLLAQSVAAGNCDIFGPNPGGFYGNGSSGNVNNSGNTNSGSSNGNNGVHSSFSNGIRPSMTRNQAQKYLQEMGFSLSDSIGALVNNQMDITKALNELQSKYRMSSNGPNISNSMCNQSLSYNRTSDNVNLTRIPPGTPINPIVGQNASTIPSMMGSNFSNGIDMFHSDITDPMSENKYMNMDQTFNRMSDSSRQQSMNLARQDSFRSNFPNNNGIGNRSMSTNSGHFSNSDLSLLNQNMNRMNINSFTNQNLINQNNSFNIRPNNSNGFNGMHNSTNQNLMLNNNNNNSNSNHNSNNSNSNGSNLDIRQNFTGMPNVFSRSMPKPPMFSMNNSAMNWHTEPPVMSPNGALPDMSQLRLAKNLSCPAMPDKVTSFVIKKVQHKHIDYIKSMCIESGAMINFQLNPQAQSIIVQFSNPQDAYRCISTIQNQLRIGVEQINSQEEYMHYMSGAN